MWVNDDIVNAINADPAVAADALAAIRLGSAGPPLDPAALDVVAKIFARTAGEVWVDELDRRGQLESFARELGARNVPLDFGAAAAVGDTGVPFDKLNDFLRRAAAFRCRIRRDGVVVGSGILVGPSTVMTAWHVVARAAPDAPQEPWPAIEVQMSDGRNVDAYLPPIYASPCSTEEYAGTLPNNDEQLAGHCDVVLLRLARPVGALLGTAPLPVAPAPYKANASVFVIHYPNGADKGIGTGVMTKIRGITARWSHTVGAQGGSSGGGCFDANLTLAGLHQGRDPRNQGRLVPTACFLENLRAAVAVDVPPVRMWSLDGTADGDFVIGRQMFFEAFASAGAEGRVRGIHAKRVNPAGDLSGLPFSFRMLDKLVARDPAMRQCRLSFEVIVPDLADEITRRAAEAGIDVGDILDAAGVAEGQSAPEAVGADRGRRAAIAIDRRAGELGLKLWIFIDHPAIAFGDEIRAALEGFVDQALKLPHLRLVLAGFEAVAMPGLEFSVPNLPAGDGAPGLVAEYIAGFANSDVQRLLIDAADSAGRPLSAERLVELADDALDGLTEVNGAFPPWLASDVAAKLRPAIRKLFERADS